MSIRCWLDIHDWRWQYHSGGYGWDLWCDVSYECARCGDRKESHEDHWVDKHEKRGLSVGYGVTPDG